LGGVVHAAMGLHEALFEQMSIDEWQKAIQPKWRGTWNLHRALERLNYDVDFFLLTSSLSGSTGTATESNYCAANSFLDAFARWDRAQGKKKTVSVGLGMISGVGYLHENPEVEALLLRKGIQPLNEAEFLQVIDLAITGLQTAEGSDWDDHSSAHILTGLEPVGFRRLMASGYDVSFSSSNDPRLALLAHSLEAEQDRSKMNHGPSNTDLAQTRVAEWFKVLPAQMKEALSTEAEAESLHSAVLGRIRNRFSSLTLTPAKQIDDGMPLSRFGMDSMIASELRTWLWNTFRVDMPFLDLLGSQNTLRSIASTVSDRL
jgi:hypothetical protein